MPSMMSGWATTTAGVLMLVYAYDAAVQIIQNEYLDGQSLLSQENEMMLKTIKGFLLASIGLFNQYVMSVLWFGALKGLGPIDVERFPPAVEMVDHLVNGWVTAAQEQGTGELLPLTGEHDAWWERFQKRVGADR